MRGLLAGRPREALNLVPFSDTLGLTDPAQRTTGRDLLDRYGVTSEGDERWGPWAAGFAADLGTDPLSYLPAHWVSKVLRAGRGAAPAAEAAAHADLGTPALHTIRPADYLSMMKDEANPIGRLHALAGTAGAKVFPGEAALLRMQEQAGSLGKDPYQMLAEQVSARVGGGTPGAMSSPLAVYHPTHGAVTPNVIGHPEYWSDLGEMSRAAGRNYTTGWTSTAMPEHTAVHEIGHALHPAAGVYDAWEDMGALRSGLPVEEDLWRRYPDIWKKMEDEVSTYGSRNPAEFVAEAFAKRANVAAQMGEQHAGWPSLAGRGNPPWLSLDPWRLYTNLGGPKVPPEMLAKLTEYLGEARPGGIGRRVFPMGETLIDPTLPAPAGPPGGLGRLLGEGTPSLPLDYAAGRGAAESAYRRAAREFARALPPGEAEAIGRYTEGSYPFNDWLRGAGRSLRPEEVRSARAGVPTLDAALARGTTPGPTRTYRGVTADVWGALEDRLGADLYSPQAVGKVIADPGFLSSSIYPSIATEFGQPLGLDLPAGFRAGHLAKLSAYPEQGEVLLPRRLAWEIYGHHPESAVPLLRPFGSPSRQAFRPLPLRGLDEDEAWKGLRWAAEGTPALGAAAPAGRAAGGPGLSTALRAAREGIPTVKGIGTPRARMLAYEGADVPALARFARRVEGSGVHGLSMPPWAAAEEGAGAAFIRHPAAAREELLHAMTQRAAHRGDTSGLPLLARPAAQMYRLANATGSGSLTGLAQVLDELSAKTMAGRGLPGKVAGGLDFLFNPAMHAAYGPHFGRFGLLPRAVYHGVPLATLSAPAALAAALAPGSAGEEG